MVVPQCAPASSSQEGVAETAGGRVRGLHSKGVLRFLGVPYASAPATRRFMPPLPAPAWAGVREALDYGPKSPQPIGRGEPHFLSSWDNPQDEDEDCLRLNIWTPSLHGPARPVLVWLHGGGFTSGSGSSLGFDGHNIARRGDVVLISVTHRLNAFGHLYLGDVAGSEFADSGNVGMLDIVAALRWVGENVASFGGNPDCVTVFGQSGGAAKVTTLMSMPMAKGLFHRAIVQSGSTGIGARSVASAAEDAATLMSVMGLGSGQVDRLRAAPWTEIVKGMKALTEVKVGTDRPWGGFTNREWRPVLDGRSLPEAPFYPQAPAISRHVPLLIGTTHDESRYHLGSAMPASFAIGWEDLEPALRACMQRDPSADIAFYRSTFPDASASELLFRIFTYWRWRHSAIWQAEARLRQDGAPVFMYRMDWRTPIEDGRWRAPHMIDVPFVFDNLDVSSSFVGEAPSGAALAATMSDAWIAFARQGNPGHPNLPEWERYEPEKRSTMIFDERCCSEPDPEAAERIHYTKSLPRISL